MLKTLVKWSVDDYHQMIDAGILADRAVELLAGEIIEMSPETPQHYTTSKRGCHYLSRQLVNKADVRFNGPITLSNSEPEPDIAIVRLPESAYHDRHPGPVDIFWLIEVANSSFKKDLVLKSQLYAAAQIPEYWLVDLAKQEMIIFRQPQGDRYQQQWTTKEGSICPIAFPELEILVSPLLGQG